MPVIPFLHRWLSVPTAAAIAILVNACVVPPENSPHDPWRAVREGTSPVPDVLPVTRQGRYTLVDLAPEAAQRDLMRQLVEISIPASVEATVGETLRHVLRHSGYQWCASPDGAALDALPLPASHRHLGPMTLSDALLTLAGPAWTLSVDDFSRQVCFTRAGGGSETPTKLNSWEGQP